MKKIQAAPGRRGIKIWLLAMCAGLFMPLAGFSQTPPPNDNYSNRIVLTGTDITFSGTLAGATVEDSQETEAGELYVYPSFAPQSTYGSIWWTWTAPTDTVLTLQILNPSWTNVPCCNGAGSYFACNNLIAVYYATNGSTSPDGLVLPALGALPEWPLLVPQTLSIPVSSGSNYQIQLIGSSSASFTIRLVATNTPVIITQPRSQAVYSNASATFYVVSAGANQSSFTFQWSLNGTNLDGQTAPMLALTNIDSSMTGAYTVTVSNAAGTTTSQPALLAVSQTNVPISLTAMSGTSNAFAFLVAGELGRTYRLRSSTNLVDWTSAVDFPAPPIVLANTTSLFFETNAPQVLTVTNIGTMTYFRVTPYIISSPDAEICINNLRQIRVAKFLWMRDWNNTNNAANPDAIYVRGTAWPSDAQIAPYFPHGVLPFCPDDTNQTFDTSYEVNNLAGEPACYIRASHLLEDPE